MRRLLRSLAVSTLGILIAAPPIFASQTATTNSNKARTAKPYVVAPKQRTPRIKDSAVKVPRTDSSSSGRTSGGTKQTGGSKDTGGRTDSRAQDPSYPKQPKTPKGERPPRNPRQPKDDVSTPDNNSNEDHQHPDGKEPGRDHNDTRRPPRRWPVDVVITIDPSGRRNEEKEEKEEKKDKKKDKEKDSAKDKSKDEDPVEPDALAPERSAPPRAMRLDRNGYKRVIDALLLQNNIPAALRVLELLKEQEYYEYTGTFGDQIASSGEIMTDQAIEDLLASLDPQPAAPSARLTLDEMRAEYFDLGDGQQESTMVAAKKKQKKASGSETNSKDDEEKSKKSEDEEEASADDAQASDEDGEEKKSSKKSKKSKKDKKGSDSGNESGKADSGDWEDRFEARADRILVLSREADTLRAIPASSRTVEQQNQLARVDRDLAAASSDLDLMMGSLSSELGKNDPRVRRLKNSERVVTALGQIGPGVVALYTVTTPDRFWIVMLTPYTRKAYSTTISESEVTRKVFAFREVVTNPKLDPLPLAQDLYRIILGPLASDLRTSGAQTLMWSFDGVMRYVPVVALHDGQSYMVERYRNVVFNKASIARLLDPPSTTLSGVGLGVSRQVGQFAPLPAVEEELRGIFLDGIAGTQSGAVPGSILLDARFTETALEDALRNGYPVVHIATHFQLGPGDARDSLLLLGDGSLINVEDIRGFKGVFKGIDLLTLSACNTASASVGSDGKEVECLGTIAQAKGARSVIASLWAVNDQSTSALMQTFYRMKATQPGLTKAEALQEAQRQLLKGWTQVPGSGPSSRALVHTAPVYATSAPAFTPDPAAPFSHPFYWAPFVLIGNYR